MSATSIDVSAKPVEHSRLVSPYVVFRILLTATAVVLCYQFRWEWLRALTCDGNLRLDALFGVHLQKIAFDTVVYRGAVYHYAIACTMADAFCGTLPLIWNTRHSWQRNVLLIVALAAVLPILNIIRLTFSDVLFASGLSWDWAHNVVSGVCYFLLWEWILSRGALRSAPVPVQ